MTQADHSVDALLFDVGGVLIDIFHRTFASWARSAGVTIDAVVQSFGFDGAYQAHERGRKPGTDHRSLHFKNKSPDSGPDSHLR